MGGFVVLGMLAAFGLVCSVWVLAGLILPRRGGILVYLGDDPMTAARRYLWLREMGLTNSRLIVTEQAANDQVWFAAQGIEIWSREELIRRLETGENRIDAGA